jgi:membrane protein YqaA with SNARE-associated domain
VAALTPDTMPLTLPKRQPMPRWAYPVVAVCTILGGVAGYAIASIVFPHLAVTILAHILGWWAR